MGASRNPLEGGFSPLIYPAYRREIEMTARRIFVSKVLLGVFTVMMLAPTGAQAQDAASFYKGKVITLLVGFNPGGGYDTYARLLAPFLEQRTGATVVVKNVPGGGSLVAMPRCQRPPCPPSNNHAGRPGGQEGRQAREGQTA